MSSLRIGGVGNKCTSSSKAKHIHFPPFSQLAGPSLALLALNAGGLPGSRWDREVELLQQMPFSLFGVQKRRMDRPVLKTDGQSPSFKQLCETSASTGNVKRGASIRAAPRDAPGLARARPHKKSAFSLQPHQARGASTMHLHVDSGSPRLVQKL